MNIAAGFRIGLRGFPIGAAIVLAGCAVGPNYERVALPTLSNPPAVPDVSYVERTDRRWWLGFRDETLNGLVADALAHNPDIRIAGAKVDEVRALAGAARAGLLPQMGVRGETQRERTSANRADSIEDEEPVKSWRYQADFDARWELDLFGGRRRALEAARAQLQAEHGSASAVAVTVAAETARAYIEIRSLQARLVIAEGAVDTLERAFRVTESRHDLGVVSDAEVQRIAAELASREAEPLDIRAELARTLHRLSILTGRQPHALQRLAMNGGSAVRYPGTPQVAFPASALAARPDVYAAEREIAAASAEIGVATAELYPRIVLLGNGGVLSTSVGDLLSADSVFASIGPRVELNLFSGGRIRAQIAAAGARARQAEARFDRTVLAALQEVSDAIVTWRNAQDRFTTFERARVAAERAAKVIAARYEEGTDDLLSLLDARRTAFAAANAAGIAEAEASLALVSLFKATAGAPIDAESKGCCADGEAS